MKTKIIIAIVVLVIIAIIGGYYLSLPQQIQIGGGGQDNVPQTMAGTAAQLCKVPVSYVEENNTTTDSAVDGCVVNQVLEVDGITQLSVNATLKGGTATSTFAFRPFVSQDGTNWFPVTGSATTTDQAYEAGTSTLSLLTQTYSVDPGTATTSISIPLTIPSATKLRLVFWGEDVSTDPSDGVKAFIQVGLEQGY